MRCRFSRLKRARKSPASPKRPAVVTRRLCARSVVVRLAIGSTQWPQATQRVALSKPLSTLLPDTPLECGCVVERHGRPSRASPGAEARPPGLAAGWHRAGNADRVRGADGLAVPWARATVLACLWKPRCGRGAIPDLGRR